MCVVITRPLGAIAHEWFEVMRKCGDEVREILHDGCPVACLSRDLIMRAIQMYFW